MKMERIRSCPNYKYQCVDGKCVKYSMQCGKYITYRVFVWFCRLVFRSFESEFGFEIKPYFGHWSDTAAAIQNRKDQLDKLTDSWKTTKNQFENMRDFGHHATQITTISVKCTALLCLCTGKLSRLFVQIIPKFLLHLNAASIPEIFWKYQFTGDNSCESKYFKKPGNQIRWMVCRDLFLVTLGIWFILM